MSRIGILFTRCRPVALYWGDTEKAKAKGQAWGWNRWMRIEVTDLLQMIRCRIHGGRRRMIEMIG